MNQPFFSDTIMCQCHITTFCTCSLVLLHLVLIFRFLSPPGQFRVQILRLLFANRFSFICIFYGSILVLWLYTRAIDLSGDIKKNPGPRTSSSQNFLICLPFRKFDIICLSEMYLDPSVPLQYDNTGL